MVEKQIGKLSNPAFQQGAATTEQAGGNDSNVGFPEKFPLEMYLEILGMVGGRKELFPLRLVSKKWTEAVNVLLEPLTTPRETEWRAEEKSEQLALPAPKLIVNSICSQFIVKAATSSGFEEIQPSSMTYPTKSMTVVFQEGTINPTRLKGLFGDSGSTLKSLCIHDERDNVETRRQGLYTLLEEKGDLKVLKIFYSQLCFNGLSRTPVPTLSNLEKLSLGSVSLTTCRELLEPVANTLVTLEIFSGFLSWDVEKYPEGLTGLQNLKLIHAKGVGMRAFPIPNLRRLSITFCVEIGKMFKFISRFQNSLVELSLEWVHDRVTDSEPLTLPKLRKLCLIGSISRHPTTLETQISLSSFPKVELLQLRTYDNLSRDEAFHHSTINGHWHISPCLKEIQWFTDQWSKERVETYTFTRTA